MKCSSRRPEDHPAGSCLQHDSQNTGFIGMRPWRWKNDVQLDWFSSIKSQLHFLRRCLHAVDVVLRAWIG
jgi:hypothetical protein